MHAYAQIARQLAEEIRRGDWPAGTALPTLPELEARFGVSRITVRGAIESLAKQGLVYTGYANGRRGTLVRGAGRTDHYATDALKAGRKRAHTDAFMEYADKAGRTPAKRFEMRIEVPPPEIADRLGQARDALAVARIVHQLLDGEPWSREASYYPRDLAEEVGLDTPHDIPQGTLRTLADAGYVEVAHVDEVTDETAGPDESQDLAVPIGHPLLVQLRTGATAERVTRVTKYVRLGHRNRLVWEIGREAGLNVIAKTRRQIEQ